MQNGEGLKSSIKGKNTKRKRSAKVAILDVCFSCGDSFRNLSKTKDFLICANCKQIEVEFWQRSQAHDESSSSKEEEFLYYNIKQPVTATHRNSISQFWNKELKMDDNLHVYSKRRKSSSPKKHTVS